MNIEAMRATVNSLKSHALDFDMDTFISTRYSPYAFGNWRTLFKSSPCGTSCCYAGETYMLANGSNEPKSDDEIWDVACEMFGITDRQASRLFYTSEWPAKFYDMYSEAVTGLGRVEALEARVEYFIKNSQARQKKQKMISSDSSMARAGAL